MAEGPGDELCEVLNLGQQRCTFMETSKNCHSSRSHCLFMLSIESLFEQGSGEAPAVQRGKLMLVDLAGSESLKKVQAANDANEELRRRQAIGINRVLSSLGTVVNNMNIGLAHGHRDLLLPLAVSSWTDGLSTSRASRRADCRVGDNSRAGCRETGISAAPLVRRAPSSRDGTPEFVSDTRE